MIRKPKLPDGVASDDQQLPSPPDYTALYDDIHRFSLAQAQAQQAQAQGQAAALPAPAPLADGTPPDGWAQPVIEDERGPDSVGLAQAANLMRLDQVRANPLFAGINGGGQTVVVIDSGADLDHPAFGPDANGNGVADRILFHQNFVGANFGSGADGHGHGTHVAGIVGSQNGTFTGMAPGSNLIILRTLDNNGSGNGTDIEEAWQWVVANRNAFNIVAVSMSIQNDTNFNTERNNPIADEIATLNASGIASIVCAGNFFADRPGPAPNDGYNAPGVTEWAAAPNTWGIASTLDNANIFSNFSARSSTMTDLAAPGSNITSSILGGGFGAMSGTSMATPMVSGLVALAQDLSQEISFGTRIAPNALLNIMRAGGVNVTDGVSTVPRVDAFSTLNGVVSFWQQSTGGNDSIFGWRGNDNLLGGNGNDIIRGNIGNDTIDGGANTDRARFAGNRGAYTITELANGSARVVGPDGTDTVSNCEFLVFDDQTVTWPLFFADEFADSFTDATLPFGAAVVGFDAQGRIEANADRDWFQLQLAAGETYSIRLQGADSGNGTLADPFMRLYNGAGVQITQDDDSGAGLNSELKFTPAASGTYYVSAGSFADTGTGTYAVNATLLTGTGNDFGADGRADILWRHANGTANVFQMNGAQVISGSNTTLQLDNSWAALDKADFNGDGRADILWRHQNGTSKVFFMNGPTVLGASNTSLQVDNAWTFQDTGDFNGDGRADILWRHLNGTANVFEMNGAQVLGGTNTSLQVDNSWSVQGVGDFNGDGRADILWRHQNGTSNVFLMNGSQVIGGSNTNLQVDNNWQVADTGDYNGDGKADILFRHNNGTTNVFLMDGATVIGGSNTSLQIGTDWHVI